MWYMCNFIQSAPVCHADMTFLDHDTGENIAIENGDLTIVDDVVRYDADRLRTT